MHLDLGSQRWTFGGRTRLMGVVNVTPDSFSDGGQFFDVGRAIAHGVQLHDQGADVLDVGGESTRPGALEVSTDAELGRVVPVIEGLKLARPQAVISVDTSKAAVAEAALAAGATMVNDITALLGDSKMGETVAKHGAALCLMHMQGTPRTMQNDPRYGEVVGEVLQWLSGAVDRAITAGVAREKLLVDPGIGFGKTVEHNLQLIRGLPRFRELGLPVLVGHSRKAFLGQLTGGKPPAERVVATAAAVAVMAAAGSADVIRVHDVAEAKDAAAVADAIRLVNRV